MKMYRWKAYRMDGNYRVYRNKTSAVKFAGEDGWVVDLFKEHNLAVA